MRTEVAIHEKQTWTIMQYLAKSWSSPTGTITALLYSLICSKAPQKALKSTEVRVWKWKHKDWMDTVYAIRHAICRLYLLLLHISSINQWAMCFFMTIATGAR